MKLILRGSELLRMSPAKNVHQLALASRLSHPTVTRYVKEPESVALLDLHAFPTLLADGLGMTVEQIANLRLGDLFEVIDEK